MKKFVSLILFLSLSACFGVVDSGTASGSKDGEDTDSGGANANHFCPSGATSFANGMDATWVLGQNDFTSNSANKGGGVSSSSLNYPVGVFEKDGKIYVGDAGNNRVLVWNSFGSVNGDPADIAVGQPDLNTGTSGLSQKKMNSAQGVTVDGSHLIVADRGNHRVLYWSLSALANDMTASYVLGQTDFISNISASGSTGMNAPTGVSVSDGKLFVADSENHRSLIFDNSNPTNTMAASVVVGQPDFLSTSSGSTLASAHRPLAIFASDNKLFIPHYDWKIDTLHVHNSIPTVNGASASIELGDFSVASASFQPLGVSYHAASGKLFMSDRGNNRVLIWNSLPTVSNQEPDIVLGQNDMNSTSVNQGGAVGRNTMNNPHHIYYNGCHLFVADTLNNRVLVY